MEYGNAANRVIQDLRLRAAVAPAGTRLPTVRALADAHHASPVTVTAAIRRLVAEGIVDARPGRGLFVAAAPPGDGPPDVSWQNATQGPGSSDASWARGAGSPDASWARGAGSPDSSWGKGAGSPDASWGNATRGAGPAGSPWGIATHSSGPPDLSWQTVTLGPGRSGEEALQALLAVPQPGVIPLSGGYLAEELQPLAALGAALARAARQPASWQRGPAAGRADLRSWFAREAGGGLHADDVVIAPGGQAALSSAFRALADPGDTVLVESPTYLGALAAARATGLRVVPVPADADGVLPDQLDAAFARTRARLFYCQPLHANPSGAILASGRRAAVQAAVRDAGAFLIEDDYARDLTIDGEAPPPLAASDPDGHVVYVRSLTKTTAPSLRIAAIGARGPAARRLRNARLLDDLFVAGPLQQAALELVTSPSWTRHRKALRTALRTRRDALRTALARHLPSLAPVDVPRGGLHLWLRLPDHADDLAVTAAATTAGVVVFPGRPWYAAEPPAPHLRLTYAAASPSRMDEAVRRLSTVVLPLAGSGDPA